MSDAHTLPIKINIFVIILICLTLSVAYFVLFMYRQRKKRGAQDLCHKAYSPGITYLSSCLNYTRIAALSDVEKCNYCATNVVGDSGYNTACQYFSGPFIDKSHKCYGKPINKCNEWTPDKKCCKILCNNINTPYV